MHSTAIPVLVRCLHRLLACFLFMHLNLTTQVHVRQRYDYNLRLKQASQASPRSFQARGIVLGQ